MIFGFVLWALSRQGKTQQFFDKFKAGIRTHNTRTKTLAFSGVSLAFFLSLNKKKGWRVREDPSPAPAWAATPRKTQPASKNAGFWGTAATEKHTVTRRCDFGTCVLCWLRFHRVGAAPIRKGSDAQLGRTDLTGFFPLGPVG